MNLEKPNRTELSLTINTYKSIWTQDLQSGNYVRIQKRRYPLQWLSLPFFKSIPKVQAFANLLGKKKQGVDFYKYYSDIIRNKEKSKWENQYTEVKQQIESLNISFEGKSILDISGEPGFFAEDAEVDCHKVEVTAFAEEVAATMCDILKLNAKKYDFQKDNLVDLYEKREFDYIFVRYAIGFCENLEEFIEQCNEITNQDGVVYVSFSPASRGVCARWMFDDYTYLCQYTEEFLSSKFSEKGFNKIGEFDEGSFIWDFNLHPIQKFFSQFYTKKIFENCSSDEHSQHNIAVIYQKKLS